MTVTKQDIVQAFAAQDRTYTALEEFKEASRNYARNERDVHELTRVFFRAATLQEDTKEEYLQQMFDSLQNDPGITHMLQSKLNLVREPDSDAITCAYTLLDDTAELLADMPKRHPLASAVRDDIGQSRRTSALQVAGTMMYQTLLNGEDRHTFVNTIAGIIPMRVQTLRATTGIVIAVMHMNTWAQRSMTDHQVITAMTRAQRRREAVSILNQPEAQAQTEAEVQLSMICRFIVHHAMALMDKNATDPELERNMIRLWLEVDENRPLTTALRRQSPSILTVT